MNWIVIIKLTPSLFSVIIAIITCNLVTEASDSDKHSDELTESKDKELE